MNLHTIHTTPDPPSDIETCAVCGGWVLHMLETKDYTGFVFRPPIGKPNTHARWWHFRCYMEYVGWFN